MEIRLDCLYIREPKKKKEKRKFVHAHIRAQPPRLDPKASHACKTGGGRGCHVNIRRALCTSKVFAHVYNMAWSFQREKERDKRVRRSVHRYSSSVRCTDSIFSHLRASPRIRVPVCVSSISCILN